MTDQNVPVVDPHAVLRKVQQTDVAAATGLELMLLRSFIVESNPRVADQSSEDAPVYRELENMRQWVVAGIRALRRTLTHF